jgi:acetyl esterase/lipase
MQKGLARNRPGVQPVRGPILLVTGGDDILFTISASEKVLKRLCRSRVRVLRSVYPGLGHDPLVYGSLQEQFAWIKGRFAGDAAPTGCD